MKPLLSASARKRVDWNRVLEAAAGVVTGRVAAAADTDESVRKTVPSAENVRAAFRIARKEFQTASAALRGVTTLMLILTGVSASVAIAGVVLTSALQSLVTGVAISTVGVSAMFLFFLRVYRLGRDQALFEFIPAKYELALSLAQTPEQYSRILDSFLEETQTQRTKDTKTATKPHRKD